MFSVDCRYSTDKPKGECTYPHLTGLEVFTSYASVSYSDTYNLWEEERRVRIQRTIVTDLYHQISGVETSRKPRSMADSNNIKRSTSRNQAPSSRPTTPLRPSSRTFFRDAQGFRARSGASSTLPLETIEPAFAELSDSMADLEANFMHLQLMHESLSRFSESFASFLYGLNMNAFCVDFPEVPLNHRNDCTA